MTAEAAVVLLAYVLVVMFVIGAATLIAPLSWYARKVTRR